VIVGDPVQVAHGRLAACSGVSVVHGAGASEVVALDDVSFAVAPGERAAIWGRSGSGKTTLLHVLGGLVEPTRGRVDFDGAPLSTLDAAARARARVSGIAYVFQGGNLLPSFTAIENLRFAARYAPPGEGPPPDELLALVGLDRKAAHLASELSGGEQQRVAIARALAQRPRLLLCDEPTGHLDSDTSERVLRLIEALQERFGFALVVATHALEIVARFDREAELLDGRIVHQETHR
jgi:ABC-type lipoprotein export system ATPase subunit